jgi:hypothetical protein
VTGTQPGVICCWCGAGHGGDPVVWQLAPFRPICIQLGGVTAQPLAGALIWQQHSLLLAHVPVQPAAPLQSGAWCAPGYVRPIHAWSCVAASLPLCSARGCVHGHTHR